MELLFTIRVALRAIMRNKLRSLLTVLGVVIGVCAVITMVNIGSGAQISIEKAISGLGTNMLIVIPGSMTKGGMRTGFGTVTTLIDEDAQAIRDECPTVQLVSPVVSTAAQVVFQNQNWGTSIMGTDPEFQRIKNWSLARGEFFTMQDVKAATKVCVLGKSVAEKLFGTQNPVGQIVRVKRIPFRVIGLLTEKGQTTFGQDQDDTVVIPYTTAQKRLMGITYLSMIMASAVSNERIPDAQDQITTLLRQRHHIPKGEDDDFTVTKPCRPYRHVYHYYRDTDAAARQHCINFARGRRHRHYEHHAGVSYRAHPRNWHPHVSGRKARRHPAAVSAGGSAPEPHWRRRGHSAGNRADVNNCLFCRLADADIICCHPGVITFCCRRGNFFRPLSGAQGFAYEPD